MWLPPFSIYFTAARDWAGRAAVATLPCPDDWIEPMQAGNGKVAIFHYTVRDADAAADAPPVDSSRERGEPLVVLLGQGGLIAGVEAALSGRSAGERFEVRVTPAQGYGERTDNALQRVPRKFFRSPDRLKPGQSTTLATRDGTRAVTVVKVGMSVVDVDLNHPLAGKTLLFDIEMVDVREPTDDERAHGHAHGADGHAGH